MNVAIIGCGLIGEKRARALGNEHKLVITADLNLDRAKHVASVVKNDVEVTDDWKKAASHPDVEMVIVATTNNLLTEIGLFALDNNKHALLEKPAGRNSKEIEELYNKSLKSDKKVKIGFNLRYHSAISKAREIFESGEIGELMFIRGRYGHGGRIGYDKEWRANPEISGGGELIDQGVHLIDLSRMFLGDFDKVDGFVNTYFWDMPVDDNGFISLRNSKDQMAWLHVSCSEWKNMFCLEVYGKYGKLQIDGLGGSYGLERLSFYKMLPEMGPPPTTIWEYPGGDKSWKVEFDSFIDAINNDTDINGNLRDAYEALKIVDKLYGK